MFKTLLFLLLSISTLNAQEVFTDSVQKKDNTHEFKFKQLSYQNVH